MQNLPPWAQFIRTPSLEVALMSDWEEKIEKLAEETSKADVTHIAGVPTWTVLLIQRIVELEKKNNILEVWPNLEVFFHGAVSFAPYRNLFKSLIPKGKHALLGNLQRKRRILRHTRSKQLRRNVVDARLRSLLRIYSNRRAR